MPTDFPLRSQPDDWDLNRKLAVLHAVLTGSLTVDDACRRHQLEPERYRRWADQYWHAGKAGLLGGAADDTEAVEFILQIGQALHSYGATAHRLESALTHLSRRLGLAGRFFSTPTAIMAAFGPVSSERTCLVRVQPGDLDLGKLAELYELAGAAANGELTLADARQRVTTIISAPARTPPFVLVLCFGVASAASAVFFGGGIREIALSAGIGTLVGALAQLTSRSTETARILELVAAAAAALITAWAAQTLGPISPYVTTLAGIVTLLPGLGMTTAMSELATRNLASGSARFAGAFVTLTGLGFGVALGTTLGNRLWPMPAPIPLPEAWPWPIVLGAMIAASFAFMAQLKVRPKEIGWIFAASALAFGGARLGAALIGPELGALLGSFVLATAANAYARWKERSATVMIVPGLLLLVPGSIGFRGFFALLENDAFSGVEAAFRMILVATSLVAGILFANVALPSRRPL